jgi:hypothetical protein
VQDLEKLKEELQRRGQAERLKTLADSADGQKLGRMVDPAALAEAMRKGDTETLQAIMSRLLSTSEGQRLNAELQRLLRGQSHG